MLLWVLLSLWIILFSGCLVLNGGEGVLFASNPSNPAQPYIMWLCLPGVYLKQLLDKGPRLDSQKSPQEPRSTAENCQPTSPMNFKTISACHTTLPCISCNIPWLLSVSNPAPYVTWRPR